MSVKKKIAFWQEKISDAAGLRKAQAQAEAQPPPQHASGQLVFFSFFFFHFFSFFFGTFMQAYRAIRTCATAGG